MLKNRNNIIYLISKLTKIHKVIIGSKFHRLKCFFYSKLKNCPNCKKSYFRKKNNGEIYKISWISCPNCGFVHCQDCMPINKGVGVCPNCF